MKEIIFIYFISVCSIGFSQHDEVVGPLMRNPHLQNKSAKAEMVMKVNAGTFDSTFVYISDTLGLPFFDEFSTNKFQTYNADYGDAGVTSDEKFRLLDMGDVPLPDGVLYTAQQTFRRTFDVGNGTFEDENFPATQIKIGDLSSYPVVYTTTNVYPPFYIYDTLDIPTDVSDTIWILDAEIFQDSATQFFAPINDKSLLWLDDEAFHNYTMAKDPYSLGVVTFDGLDAKGYPYALGATTTNFADHLTSKPIDMTPYTPSDSVYFSFLYQAQGLCDQPETGDSLVLEFYNKTLDVWEQVWSTGGEAVTDFKMEHFRIMSAAYYSDVFQFRFKNWGGLSGSLDHFHIDYVNLRTLSGYQDTVLVDYSMVYPVPTLLETYTSVPWDHYVNSSVNRMSTNVNVSVRNNDNTAYNVDPGGQIEIKYGGASEDIAPIAGSNLSTPDLNYGPFTSYFTLHDFTSMSAYEYSKAHPGPVEEFEFITSAESSSAGADTLKVNDTTYSVQSFRNYYSYDDGSAELVYGPSGIQARLAIKYDAYEADSLIGLKIHFVPSVIDVSNNLFMITVWDDNGGEPGNVIYEDDPFFPRSPVYEYDRNIFTNYYFEDTMVAVDETFYVGWRQLDPEPLGVGMDMNIVNNDKTFYSLDAENTWIGSSVLGSVMIRPVFSTSFDPFLGIKKVEREVASATLYPNPTSSLVTIEVNGGEFKGVEVYNLQGIKVMESLSERVDLTNQPTGMYIFKLKGLAQTFKVVKK